MTFYDAFIDELNKLAAGIKRTLPPRGKTQVIRPATLQAPGQTGLYHKSKPVRPGWVTPRPGAAERFGKLKKAPVKGLTGVWK